MKQEPDQKHIDCITLRNGGVVRSKQIIRCSTEGCENLYESVVKERPKPGNVFQKMAIQAGWKVDLKRGQHVCPLCQYNERTLKSEASRAKRDARRTAQTQTSQTQTTDDPNIPNQMEITMTKQVEIKTRETPILPNNTTAPRELDRTNSRKIFRMLDECYDEVNGRYVDDYDDMRLAKELSVPRAWIAQVREAHFGPAGPSLEDTKLLANLTNLDERLKLLENAGLELAQDAEKQRAELAELRSKIIKRTALSQA